VDAAFLIVVAISLCLLSVLIVARMGAGGASARNIALPVAELWLAVALWVALLRSVSVAIGTPVGTGAGSELRELASRFARLDAAARTWSIAGAVAAVGVVAHLMWSLRRTMSQQIRPQ
jgi:hypothetical protein